MCIRDRDKRYHQDGLPFNSYTLDAIYQITYNAGCITSLYTDTYTYMGGAHGETKRTSDTWDFMTGNRLKLADVYPLTPASLYQLHRSIARQIAHRLRETPGSYFDCLLYTSILISIAMLDFVWTLQSFAVIWMMTGGGPVNSTQTLSIYIYKLAFNSSQYGIASAVAVLLLIVCVAVAIFYVKQQKKARE